MLIEAIFTGTTTENQCYLIPARGCNYNLTVTLPFTADFTFDSNQGTLSSTAPGVHRLDNGLLDASLTINGATLRPPFGAWSFWGPPGYLIWSDNPTIEPTAHAGGSYYDLAIGPNGGFFQFGYCPGYNPCGHPQVTSWEVLVPDPVAGSSLSAIVAIIILALLIRRRTR